MKRTLLLMLALLLPALAAADVSAQVNAPETYSTVWQSNTGRTIVTVDAAVEIPAVPQLMIYPAVQRTFTPMTCSARQSASAVRPIRGCRAAWTA